MDPTPRRLSRRSFLAATALGGAAVASGGAVSIVEAHRRGHGGNDEDQPWFEASVPELQRLMAARAPHERRADRGLPARIDAEPACSTRSSRRTATPSTSPRGATASGGRPASAGPLHGIPVLVKDNIATNDGDADDRGIARPGRQPGPARRSARGAPPRRPVQSSSARRTCPSGPTSAGSCPTPWPRPACSSTAGAGVAASRAIRTSWTRTRRARRRDRPSRPPRT